MLTRAFPVAAESALPGPVTYGARPDGLNSPGGSAALANPIVYGAFRSPETNTMLSIADRSLHGTASDRAGDLFMIPAITPPMRSAAASTSRATPSIWRRTRTGAFACCFPL